METRSIGSLQVTIVGIGCNNFGRRIDEAASKVVVDTALEVGINFFDTADVYGPRQSEEYLGRALGARRKEVIIATKFGSNMDGQGKGAKPDYIKTAIETSLKRLGTDYIDLYQLHTPDLETPIADTLGALDDLVKAGKVREIGSSNFSVAQIQEAEAAARPGGAKFKSVQNHYSMLYRDPEKDVLAECARLGIGYLPFFPLANGLLTGKYRAGQPVPEGTRLATSPRRDELVTEKNLALVGELEKFAAAQGHTLLELAFSWLTSQPVISSVIAGATKPEQVRANAAAPNWKLSAADFAAVDKILAASV